MSILFYIRHEVQEEGGLNFIFAGGYSAPVGDDVNLLF
jgi:hypothetical protein